MGDIKCWTSITKTLTITNWSWLSKNVLSNYKYKRLKGDQFCCSKAPSKRKPNERTIIKWALKRKLRGLNFFGKRYEHRLSSCDLSRGWKSRWIVCSWTSSLHRLLALKTNLTSKKLKYHAQNPWIGTCAMHLHRKGKSGMPFWAYYSWLNCPFYRLLWLSMNAYNYTTASGLKSFLVWLNFPLSLTLWPTSWPCLLRWESQNHGSSTSPLPI